MQVHYIPTEKKRRQTQNSSFSDIWALQLEREFIFLFSPPTYDTGREKWATSVCRKIRHKSTSWCCLAVAQIRMLRTDYDFESYSGTSETYEQTASKGGNLCFFSKWLDVKRCKCLTKLIASASQTPSLLTTSKKCLCTVRCTQICYSIRPVSSKNYLY